jgi:hypothetical protein
MIVDLLLSSKLLPIKIIFFIGSITLILRGARKILSKEI